MCARWGCHSPLPVRSQGAERGLCGGRNTPGFPGGPSDEPGLISMQWTHSPSGHHPHQLSGSGASSVPAAARAGVSPAGDGLPGLQVQKGHGWVSGDEVKRKPRVMGKEALPDRR